MTVASEIGRLRAVITSSPGREFERMVPANLERYRVEGGVICKNPDYLLFDDLVLTSALVDEHAQLDRVIRAVVGPTKQLSFRDLLKGSLFDAGAREETIDECLALEAELYGRGEAELREVRAALMDLDGPRLAETLITGREPYTTRDHLRWPAPNTLFARDLGAFVGDAIVLTHAAEPARRRDMRLSRTVFAHHPVFAGRPRLDIADDGPIRPEGQEAATLEGGDVMVMSDKVVVVGVGIRTTMTAVERLAPRLLDRGFETVLACEMPVQRASMHIDTLFTRIDEARCLIYPPMVTDPARLGVRLTRFDVEGRAAAGEDLLGALGAAGIELTPVFCGGLDPRAQDREQWSDGANAFALSPGVIICYARNERTLRELNRVGYEVLDPTTFVRNATLYTHSDRLIAIALRGHELVRGRGGPRCLTCPVDRAPL